jgi:leucyl aminopeptidase
MHTGVRRSKEQVADFVMGRNVMRFLGALLGAVTTLAALLVLGFAGAYQFLEYKSKATASVLRRIVVLDGRADVKRGLERGRVVAHAAIWARDHVNEPPDMQSPAQFVAAARRLLLH